MMSLIERAVSADVCSHSVDNAIGIKQSKNGPSKNKIRFFWLKFVWRVRCYGTVVILSAPELHKLQH